MRPRRDQEVRSFTAQIQSEKTVSSASRSAQNRRFRRADQVVSCDSPLLELTWTALAPLTSTNHVELELVRERNQTLTIRRAQPDLVALITEPTARELPVALIG